MKKILAAFITAALVFGPIGASIFQDQTTHVDARGYKSGKRGFNYNNNFNKNNNGSFFQNKKQNSVKNNRSTMNTNKKRKFHVQPFHERDDARWISRPDFWWFPWPYGDTGIYAGTDDKCIGDLHLHHYPRKNNIFVQA
ncbi:hypothetical protein RWE15_19465 [Virgibacillus halophilus]|uniref:Uncharacterized protein n=1 Tax=Tigheibacillus halophilus TaxID=361280 RepID=A0ABU5CA96_9BACI|nr:hypothetical protein [Virgibacillus halophilus]